MAQRTRLALVRTESSDAAATNTMVTKSRRSHKKSRNGCAECKQRHIRCDEHKPSCTNCEAAERICSFSASQANKQNQRQGRQHRAKQQQQPETTAVISPGFEVSRHSNARTVTDAGEEHAELLLPVSHQQNNHAGLGQAPGQQLHDFLPSITGFDANPHQIPSPASPIQLSNVHTPPVGCCPGLSTVSNVVSKAIFNPQHMILMHHANTVPDFTRPNRNAVGIAVRHAIDSPYLLDEILAFTAFYLASLYPGSAADLRHLATELQNRALASFTQLTEVVPKDDKATAVPRFFFSAILGWHVLADTLTYYRSDFHSFIDRFIECLNLNRGITSVTPPARKYLNNSEIQPFLRVVGEAEEKIISPGNECDPLSRVMDDSDLNEASVKACRQAIEVLQWSFDLCHGLNEEDYPHAVSAFSVRIGAGFIDVLRKHRPEALLILIYYGALLYRCRSFWAFSDAGAFVIRTIAERLGSYWQEALTWPLRLLEAEQMQSH